MSEAAIYRTQEELEEAVVYWQGVLGLRDWTIKATLAGPNEMSNLGDGECQVWEEAKFARILIVRPEYRPETTVEQDDEDTLVHELLHIHFKPLDPPKYDRRLDIATEQAIYAITNGLIKLARREKALPGGERRRRRTGRP